MTIGKRHLLPNDGPVVLSRNCGCDVSFMDRKVSERQHEVYQLQSQRRNMVERTTVAKWQTIPSQHASPLLVSTSVADTLS